MNLQRYFLFLLLMPFLFSCDEQDNWENRPDTTRGILFHLSEEPYDGETPQTTRSTGEFSRVEHLIVTDEGDPVLNIKSIYLAESRKILAEGLQTGSYKLLVLGIIGDESKDQATVHTISSIHDTWLSFPENLQRPLEAEYFYAQIPFTVSLNSQGKEESSLSEVSLKRIIGKVSFDFSYNNDYVRTAVTGLTLHLPNTRFYTTFSANQEYSGQSDGTVQIQSLQGKQEFLFMPIVGDESTGSIEMVKRHHSDPESMQQYAFRLHIQPNRNEAVSTTLACDDDHDGIVFATDLAYEESPHYSILSDTESKEVYYDASQRSFYINQPLQVSIDEEARLHTRFYSVRPVKGMTIYARISQYSSEWLKFAYFDEIPVLGDALFPLPFMTRDVVYYTESGKRVKIPRQETFSNSQIEFKLASDDPYWKMLEKIKINWYLSFASFGGDPDAADGKPSGNWRAVRPVHIREYIAFFTNAAYMWELPDCEQTMHDYVAANGDFHDDQGQPVSVSTVMEQFRNMKSFKIGLIKPGGVAGLGGSGVYGLAQYILTHHYSNTYYCSLAFHELGHCMGYLGHSSSFTYGPWAEKVMNNYYVNNIHRFPVDSWEYLRSRENPYLYNP
ncbi:hypothetical protein NEE14_012945 [Parabacteroides sp. AD58]|uniref:Uncharacterized protein n=1 Tax=Parabacteroides absconsus TaxID=2951805 RepID=A0ABZ2IP12_9BACT|nr:hypothetical protein [Parabacteroides sp. AD58]MCM6901540.1 hypothetical protein [Parabacteroides sp. AD58]